MGAGGRGGRQGLLVPPPPPSSRGGLQGTGSIRSRQHTPWTVASCVGHPTLPPLEPREGRRLQPSPLDPCRVHGPQA